MSDLISSGSRRRCEKPVVWLHGEVRSPPFSADHVIAQCRARATRYDRDAEGSDR
jgi:hypothetical protein